MSPNGDKAAHVNTVVSPFLSSYVPMQIGSVQVYALVDSGAEISIMNPAVLDQYKTQFQRCTVYPPDRKYIQTATDERTAIDGMVRVKVRLDGKNTMCKFYLVQNSTPSFILGRDFLTANRAVLKFGVDGSTHMHLSIDPRRQVVATEQVTVPANSQVVLIARIKGAPLPDEVVGVNTGSPMLYSTGLLPAKALTKNINGHILYGCANFTNEQITIPKGAKIGKFTCISQKDYVCHLSEEPDTQCSQSHQVASVCASTCFCMRNSDSTVGRPTCMSGEPCTDSHTSRHDNTCESVQNQFSQPLCAQTCTCTCQGEKHDHTSDVEDTFSQGAYKVSQHLDFTGTDLTSDQQQKLKDLIDRYWFIFVGPDNILGHCDVLPHKMYVDPKHRPIRRRCYRLGPKQKLAMENIIHDMEKQGIIQKSTSPWGAPCMLVAKRGHNSGYRFVVDFRGINQLITMDAHPLPTTEEALDSLGTNEPAYFSTLDLQSGFYQVSIDPESSHYTAFRCHLGLYEFRRLPMGLKNSPVTFQRVMEAVLRGLTWKCCLVYLDDVCIFSRTFESHLQHIEEVFKRLKEAGLKLRPNKCKFALRQIKYLGHIISSDGIMPDPEKVSAVQEYPVPQSLKDLRAFLGLSGYYRKFVKDYAKISIPLYALTKKGVKYVWTTNCDSAFQALKLALTSPPLLAYPDYDKHFKVYTDASSFAVGGVLAQDKNGTERVICYVGRSLKPAERNYGITEKECLALVFTIRKLDCYLRYSSFTAIVDHSALKWLFSLKEPVGKFARWITFLQGYNFQIEYRPGQVHQNADAISRREYNETSETDCIDDDQFPHVGEDFDFMTPAPKSVGQVSALTAQRLQKQAPKVPPPSFEPKTKDILQSAQNLFSPNNIRSSQGQDEQYTHLLAYLTSGTLPADLSAATRVLKQQGDFFLNDGILYHVWIQPGKGHRSCRSHVQLVIPTQLVKTVLTETHDSPLLGGHLGIARTMDKTRTRFYWPTMHRDIMNWVKSCEPCNRRKRPMQPVRAQVIPMPVPSFPFERVSTDILGPLPTCKDTGHKYVLVFIDNFSKYMELIAVPDTKAERIAWAFVKEIVCRHGTPAYLHSDRGTNYLSNIVRETCKILKVTKTQTTSYHPQCNGQSERCMSYILASLAKRLDKHHDSWDLYLPLAQYVYNTSPCLDSTGYTPAFLVHGRILRSPIDNLTPELPEPPRSAQQYVAKLFHVLESARQDAETTLKERKDSMQTKFQPKVHNPEFHVGDSVYLYHPVLTPDQSAKLRSPWTGPHYIVQKFSNVNVQLRRQSDNSLLPGRVHVNRLKKATDRNLPTEDPPQALQDTGSESSKPQYASAEPKDVPNTPPPHEPDTLLTPPQDDATYYEVEKLVAKRRVKDKWQYRVKWLTFPSKSNSWVTYEDLNPLCQQLACKIHDCLPTYGQKKAPKCK